MSFSALAALYLVWVLAIASPGPDIIMLTHQSSRGRGVPAAFGVVSGSALWIIASLAGVTWLTTAYPRAYSWVVLGGALFLMIYGFYILVATARARLGTKEDACVEGGASASDMSPQRSAPLPHAPQAGPGLSAQPTGRIRKGFLIGLATNLSNPKALAFFTALFASMVPQPMTFLQGVLLTLSLLAIALAWFVSFALIVQSGPVRRFMERWQSAIDIILGVVLLGLGAALALGA